MTVYEHTQQFHVRDPYSALTHFIGFVLSVAAMAVLLIKGGYDRVPMVNLIGVTVFAASSILLYGASTSYHTFDVREPFGRLLKKIDHLSIFILIAGTYTPYALIALDHKTGMFLLLEVWGIAIVGMIFKLFWVNCPKWVSSVIYIAMGWVCLTVFPQLLGSLSTGAFVWTLLGGIFYTIGGVVYSVPCRKLEGKPFGMHEIFHCFVLAGSFCFFMVMYLYFI
ncbi:MAG: hemolysin III family protein [Bulleidia sp.]